MSTISEPIKRKKPSGPKPERPRKSSNSGKSATLASIRNQAQSIDLLAILVRRRALIVASALAGLMIGACYYLFATPKYESRAEIMLLQNDSVSMSSNRSDVENISQDLLATHMSLIQSQRIIDQALTKHGLAEMPSLVEQISDDATVADYVRENIYVTRGGKGSMARNAHTLNVAFRHTNKDDSTKIVSALVQEYQEFVASKFKDINEEAVKLINTARLELDQEIEAINTDYKSFRNSAPLIASNGGSNVYEVRYQDLASEASTLAIEIDEKKGRLAMVMEGLKRITDEAHPLEKLSLIDEASATRLGIMVTVDSGQAQTATFQALQPQRMAGAETEFSKLLELKTRLTNARVVYGPKHPQVQELETQIEEIERFLNQRKEKLGVTDEERTIRTDDVMNAYVRMLKNDIVVMEQRLSDLKKQQGEAEVEAKNMVRYEIENEDLLRRRERQESLYDSVIGRLREINMQQDSTRIIQEVIQPPTVGEKVSPNGLMAGLITMLASALLIGFGVLVAELTDKSVHSVEELEELYGTSVIGQILDFGQDDHARALIKRIKAGNPSINPEIVAYHDSKNPISEVIRTIRTQVLFNLGADGQVLAVTSPQQGDGKSTITSNLAVSLAITNKRVLLIDCDLRRPQIHQVFGASNERGLSDICLNHASFDKCLQPTMIDNLTLLTSGDIPEKPAELLSSECFRHILAIAKEKFDLVVLDCPPLLPVTDPAIIAPLTDGVLLVTRTDSESMIKSQECQRVTSRLDAKLVGIVINRSQFNTSGYYKKYQGYYQ